MRYQRALEHLRETADLAATVPLDVRNPAGDGICALWVFGDVLDHPRQALERLQLAFCVDRPPAEVAWWVEPPDLASWADRTRINRRPIESWWRPVSRPVWNHYIRRPALVWSRAEGLAHETLAALDAGDPQPVRAPQPSAEEYLTQLRGEEEASRMHLVSLIRWLDDDRTYHVKLDRKFDRLERAARGLLDTAEAVASASAAAARERPG